jgi:dihydrofolate synthase/folylpolyglutamate synthase
MFGTRLGLETTSIVLSALGDPHLRFSSVLVAGTNGKGSVAALLSAIGSAAGYKTGLFTSPHLESVTERIKIDGRSIEETRLGHLLQEVSEHSKAVSDSPATYFESLFIAACKWFAEQDVQLVILEVGLGGRLDATNVSDPVLAVVTEIALEHTNELGSTTAAIAREKAGVFRRGRPVVAGARDESAVTELERLAAEIGASWHWAPKSVEVVKSTEEEDWSRRLRLRSKSCEYDVHLCLAGRHQERNLLTAIVAAELLAKSGWDGIDQAAIETGVETCRWPGRLERVEIPGKGLVVLDAAHNPSAAQALASFLEKHLPRYCLLFGVLEDKDVAQMLPTLVAGAGSVILTRPASARGRAPEELQQWVRGKVEAVVVEDREEALSAALAASDPVVVSGSIYLVGEIRRSLRRRFGRPSQA